MLIVTALSIEAESLLAELQAEEGCRFGGKYPLYHGGAHDILVCGLGKERAERCLREYLESRRPERILNAGGAGILDPALQRGQICAISEVCSENAEQVLRLHPLNGPGALRCVSVEKAVTDPRRREAIFRKTRAGIVDMECLFLAGLAAEQSIPFSAIKVTSDFADNNVEGDFRKHIREGMKLLTHYLLQDSGMIKP
ncbi:MAG: hypothetical protein PHX07_00175 [Candidatus Marinimicrobia bacterium]|jgi:nucleoside phosphorylase|nr:hypothetical protein [Candidatus Neomarinimicrobiota bacterium]MDD5709451.1 hypothetical protein [Candidatus Neomarinimicrobiota bacterium]MDX9777654.1 hypothetical protein [bacterium]